MTESYTGYLKSSDGADCLEAAGVFRIWKTLLLLILATCLLLEQASFYLVDQGYIKANDEIRGRESAAADHGAETNAALEFVAKWLPVDSVSRISLDQLSWAINLINVALLLAAGLYCLVLLLSLKVSIQGRLGGMRHITRSFVVSLLMLVLLLPWQRIFGGVVIGAVFTTQEMVAHYLSKPEDVWSIVLYYLRFGGYGLLVFLLLMVSELGNLLWARSTRRRVEIAEAEIDWHSALDTH